MKGYSLQQIDIFDCLTKGDSHISVRAAAGSGKTTTIKGCIDNLPKRSSYIYLAFNNSIVKEIKEKGITNASTMHSICWRSLMKKYNYRCELDKNKSTKHIEKLLKLRQVPRNKWGFFFFTYSRLLDISRQHLVETVEDMMLVSDLYNFDLNETHVRICFECLESMNTDRKRFDFTDMIYRAHIDNVEFERYDFVFIDESQDLSKLQQVIIPKLLTRKGKMASFGDPRQAIYGFAGADSKSYENLKTIFENVRELPLSTCYRCKSNIVIEAKKCNPEIEIFKGNLGGVVRDGSTEEIRNGDWVLCRNLKPLIILNLYLISRGMKSYIKGKDIGIGLISIIKKTGCSRVKPFLVRFEQDINKERRKLAKKGVRNPDNTEKIDLLNQKLEIFKVLSDGKQLTKELINYISLIFKEQGDGVMLSTIHKSKGLENEKIFFLCPELIPSKFAESEWEIEQEFNLKYVAVTRAISELIFIDDFKEILDYYKKFLK